MLIEIFKQGSLVKRLKDCIGTLTWDNELMYVPSLSITLPAEYLEYFDGREDVKIFVNDKVFYGHVKDNITVNKAEETIRLNLSHIVAEWEYRQISVNRAIDDQNINYVFKGDKVKKDTSLGEAVTANDFEITSKQVKKLTSAKAIKRAGAQAWSLASGDPLKVTVDISKVKAKEGEYKVTFSSPKGVSVTVNAQVNANVEMGGERTNKDGKAKKRKISARNFAINIESADLSNAQLIKIAKAKAWVYRKPSQTKPVSVKSSELRPEVGKYQVVFTSEDVVDVAITVTVKDTEEPSSDIDASIVDNLEDIYNDMNFAYPGWELDWQDDSASRVIDYVYSRQNKLEALTKTIELTDDLFWRVGFTDEKRIEIGKFGKQKPYTISLKPSGKTNRQMITEPEIEKDFENVINVATVYSDKSDGGMSSLTLREVYNYTDDAEIEELKKTFPVVILRANVNNERDYTQYTSQYPKLAPNNELEYAIIDTESVALESGILIEGTYAFNDLGAFNINSRKITDAKRKKASKTAYKAAIRKLKQARRNYKMQVVVEEMPNDVNVGDKIRLIYTNTLYKIGECSNYYKKLLQHDDWYYIERMTWDIDENGLETNTLTLSKFIRVDRDTDNQQ